MQLKIKMKTVVNIRAHQLYIPVRCAKKVYLSMIRSRKYTILSFYFLNVLKGKGSYVHFMNTYEYKYKTEIQ